MTQIEKMFKNAGIKKCNRMLPCPFKNECEDCEFNWYPDFTAEKQIELIKFLGRIKDYTVEIDKFKGVYYVGCRKAGSNNKHWGCHNIFEESLAELVNDIWQSLTNQEKEEIRGILNE